MLVICSFGVALRLADFDAPWSQSGWQHLSAYYAGLARNLFEQGCLAHWLAPAIENYTPVDGQWSVAVRHPILLPIYLSLAYHAFGVHEWSTRLLPVTASILEIVVIFEIARRLFDRRTAWIAACLAATLPATAFYASAAYDIGPVLLALGGTSFVLCLAYLERPTRRRLLLLCLTLFLAVGTDWPAFYAGAVIVLLLIRHRHRWPGAQVSAVMLAYIGLHVVVIWANGDHLRSPGDGGMGARLLDHSLLAIWTDDELAFAAPRMIGEHLVALFTWPILVLAVAGVGLVHRSRAPLAAVLFLLAGAAHTLIFVVGAAQHEFWITTAAPAVVPFAAWSLARFGARTAGPLPVIGLTLTLAAYGAFATVAKQDAVAGDRYFHEFGTVLAEHTPPDACIATPEFPAEPMLFYARRRIFGNCDDTCLPGGELPARFAPVTVVAIPERAFAPGTAPRERMLALLRKRSVPCTTVVTGACGPIHLFRVR